ncbi:MAG: DNA polymerase III subunit gamma/tau [Victivallaceae bacterium]
MSFHLASYRKYRPGIFSEVLGQKAAVTLLKNAIVLGKTAHAYLFSGTRGVGKTTLARLFAKALNCESLSTCGEPCCSCISCKEIALGNSMNVIEIDGASHRGIDDIKQINETVFFTPGKSRFKVYIIDEVHMLTKEAFNALLKTLEEPPSHVKFFLATTEPHKIPLTVLSRCQKINLTRVPEPLITQKLKTILSDTTIEYELSAIERIAQSAQGSLRDAESFLDLVISYSPTKIDMSTVNETMGLPDDYIFEKINTSILQSDYRTLFDTTKFIFEKGYDITQFLNNLTLRYRDLLLTGSPTGYSEEQLLYIVEFLGEASFKLKQTVFEVVFLETVLLHLINYRKRPSFSQILELKNLPIRKDNYELEDRYKKTSALQTSRVSEPSMLPNKVEIKERIQHSDISDPNFAQTQESQPTHLEMVIFDNLLQFGAVELQGILTKK